MLLVRAGQSSVLAVVKHGVRAVPALHDLRPAVDLAAQARAGEVVACVDRAYADPKCLTKLTSGADRRGLSPLFWTHVNPYGRFELDMNSRLDLRPAAAIPSRRTGEPRPAAAG